MTSVRAEGVAEALWELKRINKLATYTEVAGRAGFKPGSGAKTFLSCMTLVRRDWPHLQWWRAIPDDGFLTGTDEHAQHLQASGYELIEVSGKSGHVTVSDLESVLNCWSEGKTGSTA